MSDVDPAPHVQLFADFTKAMAGLAEAVERSAQAFTALAEVAPVEPGDESSPDTSQP